MRLLLDECVPKRLKRELRGHEARTVHDAGGLESRTARYFALPTGRSTSS